MDNMQLHASLPNAWAVTRVHGQGERRLRCTPHTELVFALAGASGASATIGNACALMIREARDLPGTIDRVAQVA